MSCKINDIKWIKVHCETNCYSSDINVENTLLSSEKVLNDLNTVFEDIEEIKIEENQNIEVIFTFNKDDKSENIFNSNDFTLENFNAINIEDFSNLHIREIITNSDGYTSEIIMIFTKLI